LPETKLTFFKEKSSYLIYDLRASIGDERDLVISEWHYYPDDGWENEYFITIPADEVEKLYKYLPPVSRKKTPAPVRENKDKLFLFRLKRFYKRKKFKNFKHDFRNWLDSEEIKYKCASW
jgi:hypothetical protein